jgi:DNA-binding NarL/FixJ family response regulator
LAWFWITRPQVARPLADEALALARATGDGDLLARVAFAWRQSYCDPGHLPDRLTVTGEAAAMASSPADRALAAIATVLDQLEAGNRAAVDFALVELAGLAAGTGDAALRWRHGQLAAMVAIASGRPQEAERWSAEAFVHGAQAGESGRWVVRVVQSTVLTIEASNDPSPGVELLATNLESLAYPPMRGGALSFLARAGRHDLVAPEIHQLVAHILDDPGREASWLSAAAGAADAVATLRLSEYAEPLLDAISPFADHIALDGLGLHCHGCIARPAARLADLAGRHEQAARLRAIARERDSAAGLHRFLLEDQLDELEARLADPNADHRRIRSELDRVRLAAHGAGLMSLEHRARQLADGSGTIELSERQQDVLGALAEGLTYKETGDRLGFSHSTIRHEAMRIYAMLGARDRDDAVELARKRGMLPD